jgi:deoxyribodipyrimidine photo-lyase
VGGTILWLRRDLRLADNPALHAALQRRAPVFPVFILSDDEGDWPPGGAARWWLHESLASLDAALRERGSRLILRAGPSLATLRELLAQTGAHCVFWNRRYEPAVVARDTAVKSALRDGGINAESFNGSLLREPWDVRSKTGGPYRVYTPFKRHLLERLEPETPLSAPRTITAPREWPDSLALEALSLRPRAPWYERMAAEWQPGEPGARLRMQRFLRRPLLDYDGVRNDPAIEGTSRLSPHLCFGEISPRQVWHAVAAGAAKQRLKREAWRGSTFVSELLWREFAYHLIHHFPRTTTEPLDAQFARFPWVEDEAALRAWQHGRTGVPLVDAGMRQLWGTGWMHNRVRMVVASFLVKNLRMHWLHGARWFWDTLVDADLAANTLNWQWVAGCGADAAPYFRVFNPVAQAQRFDPRGEYVHRWVPELARLAAPHVHAPWLAPASVLDAAGVRIGADYPAPIVDLAESRQASLAAYRAMRAGGGG